MNPAQKKGILDALVESQGPERAEQIVAEVERRYVHPLGLTNYMNAILRESWRLEHGSAEEWDRSAQASLTPIPTEKAAIS